MNEFDWIKEEINVSRITQWTEHHLREYLNQHTMKIDVYVPYEYGDDYHAGTFKLYRSSKRRYTVERNVIVEDYVDGWRRRVSKDKRHYKIDQVVRFLNSKVWVVR